MPYRPSVKDGNLWPLPHGRDALVLRVTTASILLVCADPQMGDSVGLHGPRELRIKTGFRAYELHTYCLGESED